MQEILIALSANITFSNSTPIAKTIRTSNPIRRIVAADLIADILEMKINRIVTMDFE